jgi:hypothetical protein
MALAWGCQNQDLMAHYHPNLLNISLLVHSSRVFLEVNRSFNVLAKALNELDVDIRLHEGFTNLLEHIIDDLGDK